MEFILSEAKGALTCTFGKSIEQRTVSCKDTKE